MDLRRGLLPETDTLPRLPGLAEMLASDTAPGWDGWDWLEPSGADGAGGAALVVLHDALWLPRAGLIVDSAGRPAFASAGQVPPRIRLPGATQTRDGWRVTASGAARVDRAALWMAGGAARNYGHFLFDALPGVCALDDAGILAQVPATAPVLPDWARTVLKMAGVQVRERGEPVLRIGTLVYVTSMNAYLNRCGPLIRPAAARLRGTGAAGRGGAVYLSRRGYSGRILVEEAQIEAALSGRGVDVIRPEKLSPDQQRAQVAGRDVLIGPSGAALANMIFLPRGARVIEIRPEPVQEPWMDLACRALGLMLTVVPGSGPLPRAQVPLAARVQQLPRWALRRYHYAYSADPGQVLAALDAAR
ncbi:glycosyltransferase 61 family protein [Mesobacterium sp. TK19101]|uniref:Glycosyltransferase 61 family protein n=1 Tax=Mesobacterium hydrothermale TaxID=3111907 RepID=A0ABU6HIN1_9RHOB|nr:glycosyltransferase 61 family protein [Mesobacterium sp. TK19101]MEC3861684.1 glycosyltransferase 61 family protein [Mesobacterium sp. TK19101]